MDRLKTFRHRVLGALPVLAVLLLGACSTPTAPSIPMTASAATDEQDYIIGATDSLHIFVWRQPELSTPVIVRPDGKISVPLIDDLQAAGKTPTQLAQDVAKALSEYVQDPKITVLMTGFVGPYDRQIRVVGEAARPQIIPFRSNMSVLDVMIQVGGLTEFAAGNRAVIVRKDAKGKQTSYRVHLDDLLKNGDVKANTYVLPGDILIIPQSWF